MATAATAPISQQASAIQPGVATMSPAEFDGSSLFAAEYPFFRRYSIFFLVVFMALLIVLLGLSPPPTDSPVRSVMHYAGYAIFLATWWQVNRVARRLLADIAVNNAIATLATSKIDQARKDLITTGRKLKVEDLQQFFPANKSEPAMLRLLIRVWQDATSWRFDSLTSLIAPYQRESLSLRVRLENLQRVALRFGILGAFVGLVLALKDLQQLAGGPDSLAHMDKFLPGFLGALYLKFGASIGGLGGSLYGFTMASVAEKKQARYFQNMEAATGSLLDLAARSLKYSAFVDEFGHIRSSIKDLQNDVHDQTQKTADLAKNVGQLAQLSSNIGQFTSSLEKEHSKFLSDMQRLYDQASMERVFKNLESSIIALNKQSQEFISQQFRAGLGSVDRDFGQVAAALKAVEQSVARILLWTLMVLGAVAISALMAWFLLRHV